MFSSSEPGEVGGLLEKHSLSEAGGAFQKGRLAYGFFTQPVDPS